MTYKEFQKQDTESWINSVRENGLFKELFTGKGIDKDKIHSLQYNPYLYPESLQEENALAYLIIKQGSKRALTIFSESGLPADFEGIQGSFEGINMLFCPLNHTNAVKLRKLFPFTAPSPLKNAGVSFGVGDRLGIASPGHIRIFKKYRANPVLAQQSVRELTLTDRNYNDVLDSVTWAVFQEGYKEPWGADGDHLKTEEWVKTALSIGFTMITADVSDYIHGEYTSADDDVIKTEYSKIDEGIRKSLEQAYLDYTVKLENGEEIKLNSGTLSRIVLIYKNALDHALRLYNTAVETAGEDNFDFELSIDETDTPTTPEAHVFIAKEAEKKGIKIASLAPRFVGEFQKGIDYIGNPDRFEKSFKTHVLIAKIMGYRISVHSGSDKFRVFPIIGKQTECRFHIKTAGTNWLEAIRVIANSDPSFFRELYLYAKENYKKAREYYHVTPNLGNLPDIKLLADRQLPNILDNPDARQVIHITYGEMLKDTGIRDKIYNCLEENIEEYWDALVKHIGNHLKLLGVKTKGGMVK